MEAEQTTLVTGGAGFIGSHLVRELVGRGFHVRVLDNLSRGRLSYIQDFVDSGKVEFIDGDVRYADAVDSAMRGVDCVFHLAATNINRSLKYPQESFDVNFNGSHTVFKSALDNDVGKVVFSSSASVYGESSDLPTCEDTQPHPITPYCVSKLASEHLLKYFSRKGLNSTVLRYFNVYGTKQNTDAYYTSVIILFIKNILSGKPPLIYGRGGQSMDFVHVNDVIQANVLAFTSDSSGLVLNVGTGVETTVKKLAETIISEMGGELKPIFEDRDVIVNRRCADISLIKDALGFTPKTSLNEGLSDVIQDVTSHPDDY